MAKVTSKLQVTIPKAVADRYGIAPGDEIEFVPAGAGIRIVVERPRGPRLSVEERLALFDAATTRQRTRNRLWKGPRNVRGRGWTREELHERGRAR